MNRYTFGALHLEDINSIYNKSDIERSLELTKNSWLKNSKNLDNGLKLSPSDYLTGKESIIYNKVFPSRFIEYDSQDGKFRVFKLMWEVENE